MCESVVSLVGCKFPDTWCTRPLTGNGDGAFAVVFRGSAKSRARFVIKSITGAIPRCRWRTMVLDLRKKKKVERSEVILRTVSNTTPVEPAFPFIGIAYIPLIRSYIAVHLFICSLVTVIYSSLYSPVFRENARIYFINIFTRVSLIFLSYFFIITYGMYCSVNSRWIDIDLFFQNKVT